MLEPILKGLVEWIYGMMLDIMTYASGELLGVMSMDLSYFERTAPIISDIVDVFIALGWALLIGNLVFQSIKIMVSGAGFEAEDPKTLFLRTFVFSFLLLTSREICDLCSSMAGTVITMLDLPDAITVTTPDESMFSLGSGAKWLLVIIVGIVLMVQMIKLLFEIGERYVITSVLTFFAPLAFAMGGSKNTNDIFKGWCRMYGSMLVMMIMNIVFLKLIMSAMSSMTSGGVLIWLVFVVALTRVARKIDSHIGKIGLNPAQTGNELGSHIPGAMTMMAVKVMSSAVGKSMANAKSTSGKNGLSGSGRNGGHHRNNGPVGGGHKGGNNNNGGNHNGSNYKKGYPGGNPGTDSGAKSGGNNGVGGNNGKGYTDTKRTDTSTGGRNGGPNAPKYSGSKNARKRSGGFSPSRQNGDVNIHGVAGTHRPTDMHRPSRSQGNVSHYSSNRGGNVNSTNANGMTNNSNVNGINTSYALNKGRFKGTTGQNLQSIQNAMQNNPNRTRPPIPRDTSGSSPSGANVMGSVVKNSERSTNTGSVNTNASVHHGGTPPRQGAYVPNVQRGSSKKNGRGPNGGNTNVGGSRNTVQQGGNQGSVHNTSSANSQSNQRADIGGNRGYTQSTGRSVVGGQRVTNTSHGNNSGGDNTTIQNNGGSNVTHNKGGDVHQRSGYVDARGSSTTHSFTEHFDGTRFEQHEREVQNNRYAGGGGNNNGRFTSQQINHEYRQGKYNPASVNKKVSKSYYRKESLQERMSERTNTNRKGGGNNRKQKR